MWGAAESAVVPIPRWSYKSSGRQWVSGQVLISPTDILRSSFELGSKTFLKLIGS